MIQMLNNVDYKLKCDRKNNYKILFGDTNIDE